MHRIARWENEWNSLSILSMVQAQFPAVTEYFKDQPILSQCGRQWLNLPSMAPHYLWALRRKAEVQPWTDNG